MASILRNTRTKGILSIILVMLIWGASFTVTKVVVAEISPYLFAALRHLLACILLLPFYLYQRKKVSQPLPAKKIVLMGLVGIALYYGCFNAAMRYIPASTGALIEGLIPVAVAVPAAIFLKEPLTKKGIAGIVLSVAGVTMVGFTAQQQSGSNPLLGSLLMLASVLCWGAYTLFARSLKDADTILVTALSTFAGTAFLVPVSLAELYYQGMPHISLKSWAGIAYLAVFASALAYFLYNKALEGLPAAQVGNFLNLNPVVGALTAIIFLKETLSGWQIAGGILVLGGIWLSAKKAAQ